MHKNWRSGLVALLGICLVQACEGGGGNGPDTGDNVRPPELVGKGVVFGKLLDSNNGQGISAAEVKLEVGNTYVLSTFSFPAPTPNVAASNESSISLNAKWDKSVNKDEASKIIIPDLSVTTTPLDNGEFLIRDVPVGKHKITVSKAGYASYSKIVEVKEASEVSYINAAGDADSIRLNKAFDAQVVVTAEGAPVSGVAVFLNAGSADEKISITDANGIALFPGLSQRGDYDLVVPSSDIDGDGKYDHLTATLNNISYDVNALATFPIALEKILPGAAPQLIATSCEKYLDVNGADCVTQGADSIIYVLNQPITLKEDAKTILTSQDWAAQPQPNPARAGEFLPVPPHEVEATLSLTAANTVLKVTPNSPLKDNYIYTYKQSPAHFIYTHDGVLVDELINFGGTHYVSPTAPLVVTDVSYDNFITVANAGARYNLKFPKAVVGKVILQSYVKAGGETKLDGLEGRSFPLEQNLPGGGPKADHIGRANTPENAKLYGCNAAGACGTNEMHYIYGYNPVVGGAPLNLSDNTPDSANSVTIRIVATDAQGNQIDEVVTLPVR